MKKNIIILLLFILLLISIAHINLDRINRSTTLSRAGASDFEQTDYNYMWTLTANDLFDCQLILGSWRVVGVVPVDINVPSAFSGFDENGNLRSQDLIDNILNQEIFFGKDYVENNSVKYELSGAYTTCCVPVLSSDTVIGCNFAKTLEIEDDNLSVVFWKIYSENNGSEGNRDFTALNQIYIKDFNTVYASVDGCLTFELERITDML